MKRHPAISILGTLVTVLLVGAIVTQIAVQDPASINKSLRDCADSVIVNFDHPLERILLRLGKSRVTERGPNMVMVEPYTIFGIPLAWLRGQSELTMAAICDFVDRPESASLMEGSLPESDSLPVGWHVHRMSGTSILITKQSILPNNDEPYDGRAWGERVGVFILTTDLAPEAWVEQQEWPSGLPGRSESCSELRGHYLLRVRQKSESSSSLGDYLFVGHRIYVLSLDPYPAVHDATAIFNALLEKYAG
jgi:hypothetical protein